ncbi:MAG TPA: iron chelate uptake ABC transporter family permease subunit, partial [Thermoanaerobaculia bacterium]|nr:iron chelate uptake ABC transporter family permease subunit [Thermoanaerobaculia bacterium]
RLKWIVLTINVAMVAVATAFTGVIGFVGLIVPHILRMIGGADNRYLIPGSALLGGTLLSLADLVARVALRPAELPIGIVTSIVGVPVFLSLLRRGRYVF